MRPSKRAFEKYKPRGLFSEFYGIGNASNKPDTVRQIYTKRPLTCHSSSVAFHKCKTKPPFHSSTLKTYYSENVFVECSVFEVLASYFHFIRLFKLKKFSISVTVLLLSVHPSVCMSVRPSIQFAGCV